LSSGENIEKFRRCAGYAMHPLTKEAQDRLIDAIDTLETLDDIADLMVLAKGGSV